MSEVYVLSDYSSNHVIGVYVSLEAAQAATKKFARPPVSWKYDKLTGNDLQGFVKGKKVAQYAIFEHQLQGESEASE